MPDSLPQQGTLVNVEAKQNPETGNWWVYWETDVAYGSRGIGMTEEGARFLADKIRSGEEPI